MSALGVALNWQRFKINGEPNEFAGEINHSPRVFFADRRYGRPRDLPWWVSESSSFCVSVFLKQKLQRRKSWSFRLRLPSTDTGFEIQAFEIGFPTAKFGDVHCILCGDFFAKETFDDASVAEMNHPDR